MCPINPYQSPETAQRTVDPQPVYRSRKHAFLAGLWRGAKFGGRLSSIVFGTLFLIVWIGIGLLFLYSWLVRGADPWILLERTNLRAGIRVTFGAVLICTAFGTVIGAMITGVAALIGYRAPADTPEESSSAGVTPPQHVDQAADRAEVS
jgi:hypothetical protein